MESTFESISKYILEAVKSEWTHDVVLKRSVLQYNPEYGCL